jgi:hypothetical protein
LLVNRMLSPLAVTLPFKVKTIVSRQGRHPRVSGAVVTEPFTNAMDRMPTSFITSASGCEPHDWQYGSLDLDHHHDSYDLHLFSSHLFFFYFADSRTLTSYFALPSRTLTQCNICTFFY